MTFQERILRELNKTGNFRYLDVLVNSGRKEVKLTSDITLEDCEVKRYVQGIDIVKDNLVIDGNGYQIDARGKAAIFYISNMNVTFKNVTFVNGAPNPSSDSVASMFDAMRCSTVTAFKSRLSFINCTFRGNVDYHAGAMYLMLCEATVEGCSFIGNISKKYAGAIYNDELSSLTVKNSKFINNVSYEGTSDIQSVESSIRVINSEFSNAQSYKTSIEGKSMGNVVLLDSTFRQSDISPGCQTVIRNCDFKDSTVKLTHLGEVFCPEDQEADIPFDGDNIAYLNGEMDWVRELTQHEFAGEFLKYFPKFKGTGFNMQDKLHDEMSQFIEIWREIWPHESNFVMADLIVNVLTLDPEDIRDNYLNSISRQDATDDDSYGPLHRIMEEVLEFVDFPAKTFRQLDELIHSGGVNIALNADVCLEDGEADDYEDGIKIDVDGLVLDGQSHIIDACDMASIFKIDAGNVTIKNTVFKNAFSHIGGAVSNIGEVRFENCEFIENVASELGGAVINDEKMTISGCLFEGNSAGGVGGAIAATFASELLIEKTRFVKNAASLDIGCPGEILPDEAQGFGGAIYNNGKLDITGAEFSENLCDRKGGAMIVLPDSKITIDNSLFKNNHAGVDGGVIHTMGNINITDSEFRDNTADNNAGVFDGTKSSKLKISNSKFSNNTAENGNVIVNRGKLELIETEIGKSDIVDEGTDDETQQALPDETDAEVSNEDETIADEEPQNETSDGEFPEGYDDYARQFKDYFEDMLEDKGDIKGNGLMLSLIFALWASKFPEDANMVGAALLMASIYDDELVQTILDDFDQDEYRKRLTEYDAIDEELSSWFMAFALIGIIFSNSNDDELDDKLTSKEYAEHYIRLADNFQKADEDEQDGVYNALKDLVNEWKGEYPDDINMSLAYITLNAPYLSDERLNELLESLEGQSSGDEDAYERIYEDCRTVLEFKNIDLNDYLEE